MNGRLNSQGAIGPSLSASMSPLRPYGHHEQPPEQAAGLSVGRSACGKRLWSWLAR
jgi:hypothetical protein